MNFRGFNPDSDSESHFGYFVIMLMAFVCSAIGVLETVNSAADFRSHLYLEKSGVMAKGIVIERIDEAKGRAPTKYYIRYKFRNTYTNNSCVLGGRHLTTRTDKACAQTIQLHSISEKQYQAVQVDDPVDVLYLPNSTMTESSIIGFDNKKTELRISLFLFFLLGLIPGVFLFRQIERDS